MMLSIPRENSRAAIEEIGLFSSKVELSRFVLHCLVLQVMELLHPFFPQSSFLVWEVMLLCLLDPQVHPFDVDVHTALLH